MSFPDVPLTISVSLAVGSSPLTVMSWSEAMVSPGARTVPCRLISSLPWPASMTKWSL